MRYINVVSRYEHFIMFVHRGTSKHAFMYQKDHIPSRHPSVPNFLGVAQSATSVLLKNASSLRRSNQEISEVVNAILQQVFLTF